MQLLDGYFDIRFSPKLRLRSGKDKTPVGYEMLIGDTSLIFPERSVVSLLVPNRDVGFQAQGELAAGRLLYSGGIFNGNPPDGTSTIADVDTNNGKDLAGRVVWMPFRSAKTPPHTLNNFGVHLGGSTGNQSGALPRTGPLPARLFSYTPQQQPLTASETAYLRRSSSISRASVALPSTPARRRTS